MFRDSLTKVITTYVAALTAVPFTYRGVSFRPRPLVLARHFTHVYECVAQCGGCCPRFSLDWLPEEATPETVDVERVTVEGVNNTRVTLYRHAQGPVAHTKHCDYLLPDTGRCGIHGAHPMSCDTEPLRFVHQASHTWVGVRPYGRGWNMLRVDGQRGALCRFPKRDEADRTDGVRKLRRLQQWCAAVGVTETYVPRMIAHVEAGRRLPAVWWVDAQGRIQAAPYARRAPKRPRSVLADAPSLLTYTERP